MSVQLYPFPILVFKSHKLVGAARTKRELLELANIMGFMHRSNEPLDELAKRLSNACDFFLDEDHT